ncbi:MAG: flagellar motor switch protein FliM [bacterium]|jgi:flagellar motor switch protein FliM
MSNDILSQDEIDSLLRGVQNGDVGTGKESPQPDGECSFDFRSQERIIRGRMPGLEIANERFARSFRNSVSSVLRRFVDVNIQSINMMKFGEFMKTLPLPSNINILRIKPLKGLALFVIEAPMVFALVECFFGGSTVKYVKAEGRYFTPIEQKIIQKILGLALADFAASWQGIAMIEPEYVSNEINPQFVTIVQAPEIVIRIEIHVEVENFTGKMYICIPYSVIEPVKEKLCSGIQGDKFEVDERWVEGLRQRLSESSVDVVAEAGNVHIPIGDIMNLEVGSVINLGVHTGSDFVVKVEGVPKFRGVPGHRKGSRAVKVTAIL